MPSPWIQELSFEIKHKNLESNLSTDVCVVGAGIAGVVTTYFTLKNTDQKVILLEAFKLAHGATGHNAGQVVGYFERPFTEIIEEFGLGLAVDAQKDIYKGWELIREILDETKIDINFEKFWGWAGCQNLQELIPKLENDYLRVLAGFDLNDCLIDKDWADIKYIPSHLENTYKLVDKSEILRNLNTDHTGFIACLGSQKGVLNSALFCEKLVEYILEKYPNRLQIFEHSKVSTIELNEGSAKLDIKVNYAHLSNDFGKQDDEKKHFVIDAKKVVLCTNGFKDFEIKMNTYQSQNQDFDTSFKQNISGLIGFMSAFLEPIKRVSTAISYFLPELESNFESASYFYLTRRKYGINRNALTCVGGPDMVLPEGEHFDREKDYISSEIVKVDEFLQKYYRPEGETQKLGKVLGKIEYDFKWHGLMGYTKNGIRMIGPEPQNPNLLYNLGCNGIGILPSIYGGYKISQFLLGKKLPKSIFDPKI